MRKLFLVLYVLTAVSLAPIWAQNQFERKEGTHILAKERVYSDGEILSLPDFSFSSHIRDNIVGHDTEFLTEITWDMPPLPASYTDPKSLIDLFINVESLEGIEYWSGGRDRMHPYIKKSYRVESNGSRSALPPIKWPQDAQSVRFIHYQKDTSFGSNWYDMTLRAAPDAILMETVNLSDLTAYFQKTQDAGGVLMQMAVIPKTDRTIMYCAVAFKEFPPIGWGQSAVSGSFNHRISAIQAWFADTIFGPEER
ncbi:MAG: hypothetical protein P1P77_16560 [Spirochaetaceae bacterium]|nr:hypothetical protein [Spirochaetaceae bacterium]